MKADSIIVDTGLEMESRHLNGLTRNSNTIVEHEPWTSVSQTFYTTSHLIKDIYCSDGNSGSFKGVRSFDSAHQEDPALLAPERLFILPLILLIIQPNLALF